MAGKARALLLSEHAKVEAKVIYLPEYVREMSWYEFLDKSKVDLSHIRKLPSISSQQLQVGHGPADTQVAPLKDEESRRRRKYAPKSFLKWLGCDVAGYESEESDEDMEETDDDEEHDNEFLSMPTAKPTPKKPTIVKPIPKNRRFEVVDLDSEVVVLDSDSEQGEKGGIIETDDDQLPSTPLEMFQFLSGTDNSSDKQGKKQTTDSRNGLKKGQVNHRRRKRYVVFIT